MLRRRLMFSAALVAAGVGLVSGPAQAAGPVAPVVAAAPAGHGAAATPGGNPGKGGSLPGGKTFSSPADRTVRTPLAGSASGAGSGAGSAARTGAAAQAQGAVGDAYLAIDLEARGSTAHSIELRTIVTGEAAALDVTIDWGDGAADQVAVTSSGSDLRYTTHKYAKVGTYPVTVTVKDTTHGVQAVNRLDFVTTGSEYTAHAPTRLLDTRAGLGAAQAKVAGRGSVVLKVAGTANIPAGATEVVLNVTATNAAGAGHVVVQPGKDGFETGSNLNYAAGQTVANQVIVPVGEDGSVRLINGGWDSVDLLADVTGYFTASVASGYTTLNPVRAVDTREGIGTAKGQVPGYGTFEVDMAGRVGVPKGVTAVALNLTATGPRAAGHLTAYPSGQAAPSTSSVNFSAGQTVANSVIVPVGPDGKISIRNGSWDRADVVADVVGYYSTDSRAALVCLGGPYRVIDTRIDSWGRKAGPVSGRTMLPERFDADTTNSDIDGWVLNTTVTNTTGAGFLSVTADPNTWPDYVKGTAVTPQRPVSSSVNWTAGATVPNLVQTSGGKGGIIDFWNQGWQDVDLIVDLIAWYQTV